MFIEDCKGRLKEREDDGRPALCLATNDKSRTDFYAITWP